jgi:hypothetical protein
MISLRHHMAHSFTVMLMVAACLDLGLVFLDAWARRNGDSVRVHVEILSQGHPSMIHPVVSGFGIRSLFCKPKFSWYLQVHRHETYGMPLQTYRTVLL